MKSGGAPRAKEQAIAKDITNKLTSKKLHALVITVIEDGIDAKKHYIAVTCYITAVVFSTEQQVTRIGFK
jgi:hypothetical protein